MSKTYWELILCFSIQSIDFNSYFKKQNQDYQMLKERNNFSLWTPYMDLGDFEEKVKNEDETNFAKLRPSFSLAGLRWP